MQKPSFKIDTSYGIVVKITDNATINKIKEMISLKIEGSNKLRVSPEILLYGIEDFHDRLSNLTYRGTNTFLSYLKSSFAIPAISCPSIIGNFYTKPIFFQYASTRSKFEL
jgi:hypothetical protein